MTYHLFLPRCSINLWTPAVSRWNSSSSRSTTSEEKQARRQRADKFPAGIQLYIYLKAAGEDCSDTYPGILRQQWTDA